MAGRPAILSVRVVGDASDGVQGLNRTEDALEDVERQAARTGRSAEELGEHFGETASRSSQVAGGLGDLGGALGQLGGPLGSVGAGMEALGPTIMGLTGASDLLEVATTKLSLSNIKNTASTIASKAATLAANIATKAWAAAQWLLNAALTANPIGLVVLAIVALIGIVVLAYNRVGWFRAGVQTALAAVRVAFNAVKDAVAAVIRFVIGQWVSQIDFIRSLPGKIAAAASGMWDGIKRAFVASLNFIIRGWNGLQFKIPGFKIGPIGYDGFTLGLPDIPLLRAAMRFDAEGMPDPAGELLASGGPVVNLAASGGGRLIAGATPAVAPVQVTVEFSGVVGDPDAVAASIETLLLRRGVRLGTA